MIIVVPPFISEENYAWVRTGDPLQAADDGPVSDASDGDRDGPGISVKSAASTSARRPQARENAQSDEVLVRAAQAGSADAFGCLVERHADRVYRVALRMLWCEADAEDATQDALLHAWRSLGYFRAEASFTTWMYRIVTNRSLSLIRSRRPDLPIESFNLTGAASTPEELVEARERVRALAGAFALLTPDRRAPLVLREVEGLSYAEIADILELSVPAVKSRIHRARLELIALVGGSA